MQSILARLRDTGQPLDILGLHGASTAFLLSRAVEALQRPLCCIVPADDQLEVLARDIAFFSRVQVLTYPSYEIPPYTPLSPDPATVCARLATLHRLHDNQAPAIVLTSAEAVLRRVLPAVELDRRCELVLAGEETDRDALIASLVASGYQIVEMVRQEGDRALRGGIIDVYPPVLDEELAGPLRLDFFGDLVESIRLFDPLSQRSRQQLTEAVLLPASELLFPPADGRAALCAAVDAAAEVHHWPGREALALREQFAGGQRFPGMEFLLPLLYGGRAGLSSLFDYLPPRTGLVIAEPHRVEQRMQLVRERIAANHAEAVGRSVPALPPDDLFLGVEECEQAIGSRLVARLPHLPDPDGSLPVYTVPTGDHSLLAQEIDLQRKKRGLLAPLADRIRTWQGRPDEQADFFHAHTRNLERKFSG